MDAAANVEECQEMNNKADVQMYCLTCKSEGCRKLSGLLFVVMLACSQQRVLGWRWKDSPQPAPELLLADDDDRAS